MNEEEKAKAYDKVREKIALRFGSNVAEEIFSEFEESEDEKIRKEIIEFINSFKVATLNASKVHRFESWIAWLEKQDQKVIKELLRAEYNKGRADAFAEIYQPAQSESTETFDKEKILNEISEMKEDINMIAEKLSKEHRKYREECGINNPIMLDEIEEAFYNGFLSGIRSVKFNVYENSKQGWSKEDEKILKNLIDYFSLDDCLQLSSGETVDWLKSLKDRLKG